MIPEITILKLLCTYKEWCAANSSLEVNDLPRELQGIYRCLNSYHESNDSQADLTVDDLGNLYFATRPKDRDYAIKVFEQIRESDAKSSTVHELIKSITVSNLLRKLSLDAYEVAEGRGKLLDVTNLLSLLQAAENGDQIDLSAGLDFVTDDLELLVNDAITKHGLRWRLQTLNRMLGSLRQGDFGFIFARPETGKTTFLASEVTHMASQTEAPILWLNNEQAGSAVMLRCYQAALGVDMTTLFRDLTGAKKKFMDLTHGNIKLYDSGHIHKKTVEKLCKQLKPALIVFDQIDKIQGFDSDREDLRLGTIYQWARELAKDYAPTIGVCQADGTGEGQRWLTMGHVANAKTSKQAEADFIIGIGKVPDMGFESIRYLHLSKNKLIGDTDTDSTLRHGKLEVLIDAEIARYKDIG